MRNVARISSLNDGITLRSGLMVALTPSVSGGREEGGGGGEEGGRGRRREGSKELKEGQVETRSAG